LQQPAPGPRPGGEPLAGPAKPAEQPSPHRPWEELTEAEQFAILYPDRVAAGATSHEHADLWLGKRTKQPQPLGTSR
jgi:hypothetical protein